MPNIKSAKKRVLVIAKKNDQNRAYKTRMNHAIRDFNNAIDTNNIEEAERLLPLTMSIIDQTASKGVIHKNQAANKKSALAKRLSDVKSGKLVIVIKKDNKTIAAEKAKAAQEVRERQRAEYLAKAAERKAARAEAERAKQEAEAAAKKTKKKTAKKPEEAAEEKPKKKTAKKTETAAEPAAEEKPKKKTVKKTETAEPSPAAEEENK